VPWIVKLGGDPNLLARNARILDPFTDLLLVPVRKSSIDVAVARKERSFYSFTNLTRL